MMSVSSPVIPDSHFSRNGEHVKQSKHNLPRNDGNQLHKKRKGGHEYHQNTPQFHHDGRIPPIFAQPPLNGFLPGKFHPPTEPNFHLPGQSNFANFGSLGSSVNFSTSNLALPNHQVLNDMFNSFPPTNVQPVINPSNQLFSPLGVDIGSMSNLNQFSNPAFLNEPIQGAHSQSIPRQAVLEHLKVQELQQQQHLLRMFPKKTESTESPLPTPLSPQDRKHTHHDILRQHNEQYKMKQMKKAAVHQASTRFGNYTAQDSSHFNFIVPTLPIHLLEGSDVKAEENRIKEEATQ
jgi:hypothetical protein